MTADSNARPPGDDHFKRSMADFARRLGERDKTKPAPDPVFAAERRQAALRAYDRMRLRRGILLGSGVLAAASLVTLGILMLTGVHAPGASVSEPIRVAQADTPEPKARPALFDPPPASAPPAKMALADPTPATPPSTSLPPPRTPPVSAPPVSTPKVELARAETSPPPKADMPRQGDMARIDMPKADTPRTDTPKSVTPTPAEKPPEVSTTEFKPETPPPPAPNYLKREEVREVQQRLWSFGIDAGPVDGSAGPRTQMAAQQYRDKRGLLPAVDTVDYSLLEALRNDPTPQVARRAPPPATPTYYAQRRPPPRSNNPFDQLAAWFHSIGR